MGNDVAKSACKRIINVIAAVPIKTNELYIILGKSANSHNHITR